MCNFSKEEEESNWEGETDRRSSELRAFKSIQAAFTEMHKAKQSKAKQKSDTQIFTDGNGLPSRWTKTFPLPAAIVVNVLKSVLYIRHDGALL